MAFTFDPNTLVFNGEELKSASEAVFISAFATPEVDQLLSIMTGIKSKKQIGIIGRFNHLLGAGSGGCNPAETSVSIPMSQKMWDPAVIADRLPFCWTDLEDTFWIWATKNGLEKPDLTATEFMVFIEELMKVELKETWLRYAYFGDTAAALVSGGGVITNSVAGVATNIGWFNKIDGIWKQLFAIVATDPAKKTAGLATRNAGASYALQAFTAQDTTDRVVSTMLQNMLFDADSRMTAGVFQVTKSVYDQYQRELMAYAIPYNTERLENGFMTLTAGGITVIKFEFWDRMIRTYMDNGTKWFLPHRALLVEKENIQVGTEEEANLSQYDVFYDKKTRFVYVDFMFNLDAKVILNHQVQVAY